MINVINPTDPTLSVRAQVPEVKRREAHISLINPAHPLLPVALDCLKDHDTNRPTSQELCQIFHSIKLTPNYHESKHSKDQTINNQEKIINKLLEKINDLTQENEARTRQLRELNDHLQLNEQVIAQQQQEMCRKERETADLQQMHQIVHMQQQQAEMSTQQVESSEPTTEEEIKLTLDNSIDTMDTISHVSPKQVKNSEPKTEGDVKLTLDKSIDIPYTISRVSPAVIEDTVYIKSTNKNVILEYDTNKGNWSVIENHPISSGGFSIVNLNNVLTTVGGMNTFSFSNKLYCYKPTLKTWEEVFPPIPIKYRFSLSVATVSQNYLVVIVCQVDIRGEVIKAAVMNTDTHEWFRISDYKTPLHHTPMFLDFTTPQIRFAVVSQDRLFVKIQIEFRNHAKALVFSLPDIIEKKRIKEVSSDLSESADYNYYVTPNFGRVYEQKKMCFQIFKNKQVVGEMSVPRSNCVTAVLPHNKVMFIGYEKGYKCSADIFTISNI